MDRNMLLSLTTLLLIGIGFGLCVMNVVLQASPLLDPGPFEITRNVVPPQYPNAPNIGIGFIIVGAVVGILTVAWWREGGA